MSLNSADPGIAGAIARMKSERPIVLNFSSISARPEPTLDEARTELADSI